VNGGYDLLDTGHLIDPHPLYHRLRASARVYWSEQLGAWYVTQYADMMPFVDPPSTVGAQTSC
jgi:hypothetical protein